MPSVRFVLFDPSDVLWRIGCRLECSVATSAQQSTPGSASRGVVPVDR